MHVLITTVLKNFQNYLITFQFEKFQKSKYNFYHILIIQEEKKQLSREFCAFVAPYIHFALYFLF